VAEPAIEVSGKAARQPHTHPNDDFAQPAALYGKVMNDAARDHLIGNIVDHLGGAQKRIQLRQTALFYRVDEDYGRRVADGLGLDISEVERLSKMTQEERAKATEE
jgi:catalase